MSESANQDDAIEPILAAAARAVSVREGGMTEHPDDAELVDYQEKRLTEAAAQRVREHLTECEECARDLLALADLDLDLADPDLLANPAELPSPAETEQAWEALQQQVPRQTPISGATDGDVAVTPRWGPPLALAASVVLALGLGYWIANTTDRDGAPGPAFSNPLLVDLIPDGTTTIRNASTDREIVLPSGMDSLILRLNLGDQTPYDDYSAEILDDAGDVSWRREGLQRQPAGQLIVWVGRTEIPAGSYELRLSGMGSGETRILATYSFSLRDVPTE